MEGFNMIKARGILQRGVLNFLIPSRDVQNRTLREIDQIINAKANENECDVSKLYWSIGY